MLQPGLIHVVINANGLYKCIQLVKEIKMKGIDLKKNSFPSGSVLLWSAASHLASIEGGIRFHSLFPSPRGLNDNQSSLDLCLEVRPHIHDMGLWPSQ